MSLMWMPAQTTRPPLRTAFSAVGTRSPTAAKMMAISSGCGGVSSDPPAHAAPSERATMRRCVPLGYLIPTHNGLC